MDLATEMRNHPMSHSLRQNPEDTADGRGNGFRHVLQRSNLEINQHCDFNAHIRNQDTCSMQVCNSHPFRHTTRFT